MPQSSLSCISLSLSLASANIPFSAGGHSCWTVFEAAGMRLANAAKSHTKQGTKHTAPPHGKQQLALQKFSVHHHTWSKNIAAKTAQCILAMRSSACLQDSATWTFDTAAMIAVLCAQWRTNAACGIAAPSWLARCMPSRAATLQMHRSAPPLIC